MKKWNDILNFIRRKWTKLRLQPIRIFCFHQVSDFFDPTTMYSCDWTGTEMFKKNILHLKTQSTFIPLSEACYKLKTDKFRFKRFAVLTCDDGWASISEIIPWLAQNEIPVTLFVNPAYLRGEEIREKGMDKLLKTENLLDLCHACKPYITIASHGWNHQFATEQSMFEFGENVQKCTDFLSLYDGYIPFFAYPCGFRTKQQDEYLNQNGITPVYCDGQKNYTFKSGIHRECIDGNETIK